MQAASLSCEGELPLTDVAERTEGWSGAEVCAIWTEAALVAAKDKRAAIRAGDFMTAFERVEHRPEFPRTPALGASSILGSCLR